MLVNFRYSVVTQQIFAEKNEILKSEETEYLEILYIGIIKVIFKRSGKR